MKKILMCAAMLLAAVAAGAQGVNLNGVVWAERNVGAPGTFAYSETDYGMLYRWGTRTGWSVTDPLTASADGVEWNIRSVDLASKRWTADNDPCPAGWRVPSPADFKKLANPNRVHSEWAEMNGIAGLLFIDRKTGDSMFLPAAGGRNSTGQRYFEGVLGSYWSSYRSSETRGLLMLFNLRGQNPHYVGGVANAYSVRCVKAKSLF
jgi:uncharacterized protein (TIGR02145 family)